jgi:hypothetical protein
MRKYNDVEQQKNWGDEREPSSDEVVCTTYVQAPTR